MAIVDTEELMSVRQAAAYMGLTTQWVYELIRDGRLNTIEIIGAKAITRDEADRWLAQEPRGSTKKNTTPVAA